MEEEICQKKHISLKKYVLIPVKLCDFKLFEVILILKEEFKTKDLILLKMTKKRNILYVFKALALSHK